MKKGEMGVGTLIVFIAMLLVAAVAAGVLIQTVGSLQEKSLSTGSQAEGQISTHADVVEVSASDGRDGDLEDFQEIIKLAPGSDAIKLDQIIFTFNTKDATGTLKYRGTNSICEKNNVNGYNTWTVENITTEVGAGPQNYSLAEDLDDDGQTDYVSVVGGAADVISFELSSQATTINISLGGDIDTGVTLDIDDVAVSNGTDTFAYVSANGLTITVINTSVEFLVTPYEDGQGYFAAVYEQTGTNWVNGNLQRGDVIRLCYEAPRDVTEDEAIRLNFIPKIGTATLTEFVTPDVISTERAYLYP